jgi:hypothetical protein
MAKKEAVIPNKYPEVIDKILKERMGIEVSGIDSLLRDWNVDEVEYIVDDVGGSI